MKAQSFRTIDHLLAWSAHLLTASGILFGFIALLRAIEGATFEAMCWLLITLVIDGIDGFFARRFRVTSVLPNFDGKRLDYVVDFVNYVLTPALILLYESMLPSSIAIPAIAFMLVTSLYHYGNKKPVSEDMYFIGFPAWWNALVFYMFVLNFSPALNTGIVIVFSVLHFLPVKFVYVSQARAHRGLIYASFAVLTIVSILLFVQYPAISNVLRIVSVIALALVGLIGLYATFRPAHQEDHLLQRQSP